MSWNPSSISRRNIYSERQGWGNGFIHDVFNREQVGVQVNIVGTITSLPCNLVIGFLSSVGGVEQIIGEKVTKRAATGSINRIEDVYGVLDSRGISVGSTMNIQLYCYDIEGANRILKWDTGIFRIANIKGIQKDRGAQWGVSVSFDHQGNTIPVGVKSALQQNGIKLPTSSWASGNLTVNTEVSWANYTKDILGVIPANTPIGYYDVDTWLESGGQLLLERVDSNAYTILP